MPDGDDTPPEDTTVTCAGGVELRPLGAADGPSDDQLLLQLRRSIRARGGNVQSVLGRPAQ